MSSPPCGFTKYTVVELKQLCKNFGLKNFSKLKKNELKELLQKNSISSASGSESELKKILVESFLQKIDSMESDVLSSDLNRTLYFNDLIPTIKRLKEIEKFINKSNLFTHIFSLDLEKLNFLTNDELKNLNDLPLNLIETLSNTINHALPLQENENIVGAPPKKSNPFEISKANFRNTNKGWLLFYTEIVKSKNVHISYVTSFNHDTSLDTIIKYFLTSSCIFIDFILCNKNQEKVYNSITFSLKKYNSLRRREWNKIQGYYILKKLENVGRVNDKLKIEFDLLANEKDIRMKIGEMILLNFGKTREQSLLKRFESLSKKLNISSFYPHSDLSLYHTNEIIKFDNQNFTQLKESYEKGDLTTILPGRIGQFDFYQFREIETVESVMDILSDDQFSLPSLVIREMVYLNTILFFKKR